VHEAEQDFPVTKKAVYELRFTEGIYEVLRRGEILYSSDDLSKTIFNLQWLIHREALGGITDRIRIHAGCGEWDGRFFLLVGDKGAGKTTLMVSLLLNGFRVMGDELALIRGGKALPFPRRFHVKEEGTGLLSDISELFGSLPFNWTSYGQKMYSLAPQDLGRGWKIEEGEVHSIFYLVPNHGGESRIEPCPKYVMVNRIMPMSFLSETADHLKIGQLCGMIDGADCYILYVGDLEGAVSGLREKMSVI
jgi:hypothetical protein